MHRIVSFVCRYTANVRVNVNVVSLYLSCYTSYIVRDFAKRSTGISTRRFARTLTFVRKFYQFDNIVQRVSREGWHERRWFYVEGVKNQNPWMGDIDFWKYVFWERGCEKCIRFFFFGKCLSRWPCRVECVKVFVFKIMEFVIEFLFFWILFFSKNINWNSSYFVSLKKICTKLKWQFS